MASTSRAAAADAGAPMDVAQPGDRLSIDDLAAGFDFLMAQARALNAEVQNAPDVATQQRIARVQNDLFERAARLNAGSIDLLAGQARITAEHIGSAVAAAQAVIDRIAAIEAKLAKLGAVLDFFGTVLTGDGAAIVAAAGTLKQSLAA